MQTESVSGFLHHEMTSTALKQKQKIIQWINISKYKRHATNICNNLLKSGSSQVVADSFLAVSNNPLYTDMESAGAGTTNITEF